jgi:quinol monooxygenase YgiN
VLRVLTKRKYNLIVSKYRAAAVLRAKSGQEEALAAFTLEVLPEIRKVDGLRRVEVSRSLSDRGQFLLYYWWESPNHSEQYIRSPLYAKIASRLEELVKDHLLVVAEIIDRQEAR